MLPVPKYPKGSSTTSKLELVESEGAWKAIDLMTGNNLTIDKVSYDKHEFAFSVNVSKKFIKSLKEAYKPLKIISITLNTSNMNMDKESFDNLKESNRLIIELLSCHSAFEQNQILKSVLQTIAQARAMDYTEKRNDKNSADKALEEFQEISQYGKGYIEEAFKTLEANASIKEEIRN